ncbi:MAG TPA: hypothetical protein VMW77_07835 [Methanoregula sp.]|nr:hypothetical protein [Methanoregula sp.]
MKNRMAIFLALLIAGVLIAGCTQVPAPAVTPVPTPLATQIPTPAATIPVPQLSFSLGDHYLQESYSFQSEKDIIVEQVRVDNPSWGVGFDVLPLNEDLQYCWFEMKVTNIDTQQFDIFGFGRDKGFEKHQLYPMYTTGPYKIEMKGNRVKVDVTVAKRNP